MSRVCSVCDKAKMKGKKISHSHIRTNKQWSANVQKVRIVTENGAVDNQYVCTRCLKSDKITRA